MDERIHIKPAESKGNYLVIYTKIMVQLYMPLCLCFGSLRRYKVIIQLYSQRNIIHGHVQQDDSRVFINIVLPRTRPSSVLFGKRTERLFRLATILVIA